MQVKALGPALMLAVLGACTPIKENKAIIAAVDTDAVRALEAAQTLRNTKPVPKRDFMRVHEGPYINQRAMEIAAIPLQLQCQITYDSRLPVEISDITRVITRLCNISVRITADAMAALKAEAGAAGASPGGSTEAAGAAAAGLVQSSPSSQNAGNKLVVNHQGALNALLDSVTSRLGLSWRFKNGVITIYHIESRAFTLAAIPTDADQTSSVTSGLEIAGGGGGGGGSSGGGSGSGGSNQQVTVKMKTAIWSDIQKTVESMLTPKVGRLAMAPSAGTVTVTDTPEVLESVGNYIKQQNELLTKQVLLNVQVLSVQLNDADNLGIDWSLVYKTASGAALGLKNVTATNPDAIGTSVNILNTASGGLGKFADSSFLLKALSEQGRVSVVTSPSITALNLQAAPVQVAKQTSYLASLKTTAVQGGGAQTEMTPGSVTSGFSMTLIPYILSDKEMLLQYNINLSLLEGLRRVTSGGNTIEIPEVNNRIFLQKVKLKPGETLVLSGFEQSTNSSTKKGMGSASNWGFGGSMSNTKGKEVLVITITPVLTD